MKSKKVLIADDNDLNRKLFENLLGQIFAVECAKNGLEALQLARNMEFDLILMDIQMPLMDGITAMHKIRQETGNTCPILAVTAYAEASDRGNFLAEGFDDFITKPIRPLELLQLLKSHVQFPAAGSASDPTPKPEYPILDQPTLLQLLKYNSKSAIRKIFDDFVEECLKTERMIDRYPDGNTLQELLDNVHMLKGTSGSLGAMGIFQSASKAEAYGKSQKMPDFEEELKKMKNEIRQFRDFLRQEPIFDT